MSHSLARIFAWVALAVFLGVATACGGVAVSSDAAIAAGGDAAANGGGRGESAATGGACAAPAPLQPTSGPPPSHVGCYAGTPSGWMEVPCLCALPVSNAAATGKSAWLRFTVTPDTAAPSLMGLPDIEISVEDGDVSWYRVWATQPGVGRDYTVTNTDSKTTVRLGMLTTALFPVPLAGCETRQVSATITGSPTVTLAMAVDVADNRTGANYTTTDSSCEELIHP